ncbi:MAG: RND transporter [Phenylobacterium sp.]|uniref:efflux transporter outer membrane subunit n=1 Tax=Phenylobacterium sp. TaxID=1871053 RepID=UPI0025CCB574|nr:efflux transporter outer membrane subunit [Phenylobacterium sp.]MBA4010327.1 RND transporter [Phenylobacterium sp.]
MRSWPLLFALAASACSLAPRYEQPVLPVAQTFPTYGVTPDNTVKAAQLGWRDFFNDSRLEIVIATALANNRDLAVSVAQVEQARAQYRIARSAQLPNVDLEASGGRTRQPGDITATGQPITAESYDLDLGITAFELDFWGRVRNLSDAARYRYLASVEGQRAFRLSLIRQVAIAYMTLRENGERIALAERTLASRREGLEIARLRLEAGVTSSADYDQSVSLLTDAQTQLAELRRTEAVAINLLTVLVGGPIDTSTLPRALPLAQQQMFDRLDVGLPSELLINRPDIMQAEAELRAANADIGAARAAYFPRISLTGATGYASRELDGLVGADRQAWNYGVGIVLPLLDWGARRGQLDTARAQRDIAVATYQRTVQGAFQDVADALAGRRYIADQITAQELAVAAQERLAETAHLRYANGIAIYLEVLDAERNLFSAQQSLLQLRGANLRNQVSLYIALGGGQTD